MKLILIALSACLFSFPSTINTVVDRIGVNGPLKFNNANFNLAWSDNPSEGYYVQEYLPEGESLESFNQMLTISVLEADISAKKAVKQKVQELEARKKTDAVCKYLVTESPDGKEFIVDFILSESKGDLVSTVEFNVYRYKRVSIDNDKDVLLLYSYSKRSYGDAITPFFKTLGKDRGVLLNEMISTELPSIAIDKK